MEYAKEVKAAIDSHGERRPSPWLHSIWEAVWMHQSSNLFEQD